MKIQVLTMNIEEEFSETSEFDRFREKESPTKKRHTKNRLKTDNKIMIVDDEKIFLRAAQIELESAGYNVKVVSSGNQSIKLAGDEKFAIVFTDLIMPDMSGIDVCKAIKTISPETEVVLISGHPEQIQACQADFFKAGGRDEILRKPLLEDELIQVVKKLLSENK